MSFDLTGKRVLVTGGTQGIGAAICRGLGKAGATVLVNARNNDKMNAFVAELRNEGIDASGFLFDITNAADVKKSIDEIEKNNGPIDILVNNAGIIKRAAAEDMEEEDWNLVIQTNLTAPFILCKYVGRYMLKRRAGKIINICSLMSELGRDTVTAYAAAKGGTFLHWKAETPHGVLYVDGEMPASILQERLARIVLMNGDTSIPGKLRIITPDLQKHGMPDLATNEGQEIIERYIDADIDLIILDNISCLAPSIKENDASDWAPLQTWILKLRTKDKSVLLIHHSGKGGAQRGTSKKENVLDTVIFLERPKDYESNPGARFNVKFEKNRGFFGEDAKPFEVRL